MRRNVPRACDVCDVSSSLIAAFRVYCARNHALIQAAFQRALAFEATKTIDPHFPFFAHRW